MAVSIVDFTKRPERTTFTNSSEDDVACAKTFWQSVTLLPPMESRLVSSDIKQRLRTAPQSSQKSHPPPSGCATYRVQNNDLALQEFFTRARNMTQMEEFMRLREFASARDKDREMLHRRRQERKKREEVSRPHQPRKSNQADDLVVVDSEEESYEDTTMALKDLDTFDKLKSNGNDEDSD